MSIFKRIKRRDPTLPSYRYPLQRTQERSFAPDFKGPLYVWDIDETYLSTDIDTVRGMLAVPLDLPIDKRNVAGTDVLLRALRRGPKLSGPVQSNPLYFVSASPPQLRKVIEKKMLLDGVEFDGITFKDQLTLLRAGRVSMLKHHIAYKLSALLLNRSELPWGVEESLFGDDTESDALIYALYADIVAGRLRGPALANTLKLNGCESDDCSYVARLAGHLRQRELVSAIYIRLKKKTPPARFHVFNKIIVPCYDMLQIALHLLERGHIADEQLLELAKELVVSGKRDAVGVARSSFDLAERKHIRSDTLARVWPRLKSASLVPQSSSIACVKEESEEPKSESDFITPSRHLDLRET